MSVGEATWNVYLKEVRCLARDRHTLIYSLIVPLFLYPALLLGVLQMLSYARGLEERHVVKVACVPASAAGGGPAVALKSFLAERPRLDVLASVPEGLPAAGALPAAGGSPLVARWLRENGVDLIVSTQILPASAPREERAPGQRRVPPRLAVTLVYDGAGDASMEARRRVEAALEEYSRQVLEIAARDAGAGAVSLDVVTLHEENLATVQEFSNYLAGMVLPLLLLIMIAMGALYPALDCTVGERERGTLETTLLSPAPHASLVLGKYLAVVSFALGAFVLNFLSMALTLSHLQLELKLTTLVLSWTSIHLILAAALLLALFLSAVMMLLAFFARTFKEGQTYVLPVYLVALACALATSSPERSLTLGVAWVPLVNLVLLFRDALYGDVYLPAAGMAFFASALYVSVVLAFAVVLVRRETTHAGGGLFRERGAAARRGGEARKQSVATHPESRGS